MSLTFRPPIDAAEYEQIAALHNLTPVDPVTPTELADAETSLTPAAVRRRMVAVDATGRIVGTSRVRRERWMAAGQGDLSVVVAPECRRQGIGTRLHQDALADAHQRGITSLLARIHDHEPAGHAFAERCAFRIRQHWRGFALDLTAFDASPFATVLAEVEASGIRFGAYADFAPTEAQQRRLYDLNRRTSLDAPGEDDFPTFAEFQRTIVGAPWFRADGQLLAMDGPQWVGLSAVGVGGDQAENAFTGVERSHRRRHIALALTVRAIAYARAQGASRLKVVNDSRNVGMLRMQERLGYQPIPGKYILEWMQDARE